MQKSRNGPGFGKNPDDSRYVSLLEATMEATADGILVVDNEGQVVFFNSRFQELWKIPDDLIKSCDDRLLLDFVINQLKEPDEFLQKVEYLYAHPEEESFDHIQFRDGRFFERFSRPQLSSGTVLGRVWSFRDVSERRNIETALKTSEEKYRSLAENLNVGLYRNTAGEQGRFIELNPTLIRMFGYSGKEEFLQLSVRALYLNPEDRKKFNEKMLRHGFVRDEELLLKKKDGTPFWCSVSAVAVRDENGDLQYFDGIIEDISDRKKALESLQKSEMMYRALFEYSHDPIFIMMTDGTMVETNRKAAELLGYQPDEMSGRSFKDFIVSLEENDARSRLEDVLKGKDVPLYERNVLRKDGTTIPVEVNLSLIYDPSHRPLFLQSIVRDITQRKEAEKRIKTSLHEKEILLREIHHRVKNNLQIISSLLNLQSRSVEDREIRDLFRESQNRIRSMALIHESLYQSGDLAHIDFAQYVQRMSMHMMSLYHSGRRNTTLSIEVKDVFLDINKAIPCGLIINELLSNALKHAFPDEKKGEIVVRMEMDDRENYQLLIKDNGIGFPEDLDLQRTETLGLQLVTDLVRQLNGNISLKKEHGSAFKIVFPANI